ncbi:hypothetical protein SAMN05216481_113132 [Streptomyces radiopugnans]|uniref:Uncharacterized protein n=1 Tax=Streptomyces radiopugnans TaxID=403935 RepID=A0A1H9IBQ9_9ACTN|nr:hypothetical protein SAMN05216481_113132 [Streptomyces radiopugnans]
MARVRVRLVRAVVAAVTGAAVAAGTGPAAAAAPSPPPSPAPPPSPPFPPAVPDGTGLEGTGPADGAVGGAGAGGGVPVSELLTRMRDLYRRAEDAGEAHGAVEREVAERRGKVDRLQRELAGTRVRLAEARDETGRLARQHYRGASGVLPPSLRLLFGRDEREVRTVLEHGRAVERVLGDRAAAAARLAAEERRLDRLATRARGALDRQLALAADSGRRRDEAGRRLAEVERALASLGDGELAVLRRAEAAQHGR